MENIVSNLPILLVSVFMISVVIIGISQVIWGQGRVREFLRKMSAKLKIIPHYTELNLFLMSFTIVLALVLDASIISTMVKEGVWVYLLLLAIPVVISTYHVFSLKKKTKFQKDLLLTFAIATEVIIGALAIIGRGESTDLLTIFPIINLYHGVLLWFLHSKLNVFDASSISDRNTKISEAIAGAFLIVLIFSVSQYILDHHVYISLSICFGYIAIFNGILDRIFINQRG